MEILAICPKCTSKLLSGTDKGLCPTCLLQLAQGGNVQTFSPSIDDLAELFPQLEIIELIGKGGMGVVYKARQRQLNRLVALKLLSGNAVYDAQFTERFLQEASTLARLNHPNIVAIYDSGEVGGIYFLLMEYVDGTDLRRLMQAQTLKPDKAIAIILKICDALQFAHEQGVVHRDIKPENILVDKQGRVKVSDFGLAKLKGNEQSANRLTGMNMVMGTPHYMAPEQEKRPQSVDHRADVYSLGVVFYEMLTGELPLGRFALPSAKVHVNVKIDEVVLHSLEIDRERRYQNVSDMKTAVVSAVDAPVSKGGAAKRSLTALVSYMVKSILIGIASITFSVIAFVIGWTAHDWRVGLIAACVVMGIFMLWGLVNLLTLKTFSWADFCLPIAPLLIAMAADFAQLCLFPIFAAGVLSPFNDALNSVVLGLMVWQMGFHVAFLPALVVELMPGVNLLPSWTLSVVYVMREKRSSMLKAEQIVKK